MAATKTSVLHEITPLSESSCLYVTERKKTEFNYPIHTHKEFEINYIENAAGAQRVVGDSIEEIGDYELVMISNENLEHGWLNHNLVPGTNIREVTIQFSGEWLSDKLLMKTQFLSINHMLKNGNKGLCFSLSTILKVRSLINSLVNEERGFYSVITFLSLLFEMSMATDTRMLSSTFFAKVDENAQSRRIKQVDDYIRKNFSKNLTLHEVAQLANMSDGAFSRFFTQHTGRNFTEYLIDIRIGMVTRMLIDTSKTIAEICYECGYNNISNFNRIFKKKKGRTPHEFREIYAKKKTIF